MGRPRKSGDAVKVQLNAMVIPSVYQEVEGIAIAQHRTRSQVAEMLLQRGLQAFRIDGLLEKPIGIPKSSSIKKQPQIGVLDMDIADRKAKKKQGVH